MRARVPLAVLLIVIAMSAGSTARASVPGYGEIRERYRASDAWLLSREGEVIHELRVDPKVRRLAWQKLDGISPALVNAVIAIEDKRFYDHAGVDWQALLGSAMSFVFGEKPRGASTITMQLASLADPAFKVKGRKTLTEKWRQIQAARAMERTWSKEQILEAYLNLVYYRGELQGIRAAAEGLFGKAPHGLTASESLLMATLLQSPNAPWRNVAARACRLSESLTLGVPCRSVRALAEQALGQSYAIRHKRNLAPHVARHLLGQDGSPRVAKVQSTIMARLQQYIIGKVQDTLAEIGERNVGEAAVLVLDNRRGEVLGYVANSGDEDGAYYVDGIRAPRQAGSTLKPFLFGLGIEDRLITAATLLEDKPVEIRVGRGLYRPKNYDHQFHGSVPARVALAASLNVPSVRMLELVGLERFLNRLQALGLTIPYDAEFYGPSLALGAIETSLWELTNAYRVLAQGGQFSEPTFVRRDDSPTTTERVIPEGPAFIVSQILSQRDNRALTFGLENHLATRYWTAAKTGTSKDMRDNWCIGYSEHYTVGVWVGNFSGEPMRNVSGITGAGPIWLGVMNWLHRDQRSREPSPPDGVVKRMVTYEATGRQASDWFLEGTEAEVIRLAAAENAPRIAYPTDGMNITLDPDIPAEVQRLFFKATHDGRELAWQLDGRPLADEGSVAIKALAQGPHRVALLGAKGRVVDEVVVHVSRGRASGLPPAR